MADRYPCDECDRDFGMPAHLASHKKTHRRAEAGSSAAAPSGETGPPPSPDGAGGAYADAGNRPTEPKAPKPKGLAAKLFGGGSDGDAASSPGGTGRPTERRPAVPKRRVSTAEFWGEALGPAASLAARNGYVPMARAMVWSAPVAGDIIEDVTKGTFIDKGAQVLCRQSERWESLFDLIGFWGAIGMAQANPAQAPAAMGFARKRFVKLLPRIAKKIRDERKKEQEAVDAMMDLMPDLRDLFPDVDLTDPGVDPIMLLLDSLFAAPQPQEPVPT